MASLSNENVVAVSEDEREMLASLDHEVMRSEMLRAKLIAGYCAYGGSFYFFLNIIFWNRIFFIQRNHDMVLRFGVVVALFMLYELVVGRYLSYCIRRRERRGWRSFRIVNVIVETSFPSLFIYFFVTRMHPIYGMLMPPVFLYFLIVVVSALRLNFGLCLLTGAVAAVEYLLLWRFGVSIYHGPPVDPLLAANFPHVLKAITLLVGGLAAGIVTLQIRNRARKTLQLVAERNHVTTMFGRYVSPAVVDRLLQQRTELGGELRDVCVMFLDIRNFTRFAQDRTPQEVVNYLNLLFSFMIDIVNQHGGIINKFLGDGFMAVFGAPLSDGHERENAVKAAMEMVAGLAAAVAAGRLPETRVGVGIHYGPALTGSIGSARRKEYTIIGDTVNLASRIEQLTKEFGAQVLVSSSVIEAVTTLGLPVHSLGPVAVRGRSGQLEVFRLA